MSPIPVAVLVLTIAVLSLRANVFPTWVGWLSALTAAVHLVGWVGIVADTGPLAPGGWLTFLAYPVFVLWLLAVITTMITSTRTSTMDEIRT